MTAVPDPDLLAWRAEFPILQTRTYLNSCSLGALSRRSMGYLGEYQALWNAMGASAWYELWMARIASLRGVVAELLEAEPQEVALSPSVSAALGSIASAVDFRVRNRVVIAEPDFPTLAYQFLARPELEVVRVPSEDGIGVDAERWADYVDERTAVVATSHVFYSSGFVQDVARIAEIAHAAGALFVVDGYQAMGQLPVSPGALGADVYISGPLKWMLGGPGLAYLWVRGERIEELVPTLVSWFGARDQFQFAPDRFEPREDAGRFSLGTPAVPTVYTALGGAEIIREVGIERVHRRVGALADDLRARAAAAGLPTQPVPAAHRSGIVMLPHRDAGEAVARLADRGIIVDRRGEFVRASPHFYNTEEENQRLVDELVRVGA